MKKLIPPIYIVMAFIAGSYVTSPFTETKKISGVKLIGNLADELKPSGCVQIMYLNPPLQICTIEEAMRRGWQYN